MSSACSSGLRARRARGQRGSALLIVFVFAATIAIMLYAEMPVAVFEAKREKEQLLIDRGNEYAHAVKLYVRKFGSYPTTVDQLENTNRMRFLRHRFKDPFTGKDDWRMLHAGPGGQLTDSKVKPLGLGTVPGSGSDANSSSGFGSTNTGSGFGSTNTGSSFGSTNTGSGFGSASTSSGFGQSGFGSGSNADTVVVPDLPQRPPAISANGAVPSRSNSEVASTPVESDQNPSTSLLPENLREQMAVVEQGQAGALVENSGQITSSEPGANASQTVASASPGGQNQMGQLPQGPAGQSQVGASVGAGGQNAMDTVRNMLNNPAIGAPLAGSGTGSAQGQSNMGQISGGGIAGVASKAHGHAIKTVNDQSDYALWEFYYDPTKDLTKGMPGIGNATGSGPQGVGTNGTNVGVSPGSNGQAMGQPNGSGQSSFGQNSFGQNSGNSGSGGTTSSSPNPQ
ncbi:MAG TPA: hypothetical protein VHU83_04325 [Bryobacteraceae bacterium]|jgi:hypothetical protein|nr:hypothetical protein [Bryobacteraceae bacterium]